MISAIILGAGSSTRMGRQKLLMPFGEATVLECVINEVLKAHCFDEIMLVYSDAVIKAVGDKYNIETAHNPNPERGLSSSLKVGINAVSNNTNAYMFFMGDQPLITQKLIYKLIEEFNMSNKSIIIPVYKESRGMPSIFSSCWKNDFMHIEGDVGGRVIIKNNMEQVGFIDIEDEAIGIDVDTEEAYKKAVEIYKNRL